MDIRFPSELQSYVDEMIAKGVFADLDDLIVDAVYRQRDLEMNRRRKYDELRQAIQAGIDDLDHGRVVDGKIALQRLRQKFEAESIHVIPSVHESPMHPCG